MLSLPVKTIIQFLIVPGVALNPFFDLQETLTKGNRKVLLNLILSGTSGIYTNIVITILLHLSRHALILMTTQLSPLSLNMNMNSLFKYSLENIRLKKIEDIPPPHATSSSITNERGHMPWEAFSRLPSDAVSRDSFLPGASIYADSFLTPRTFFSGSVDLVQL